MVTYKLFRVKNFIPFEIALDGLMNAMYESRVIKVDGLPP